MSDKPFLGATRSIVIFILIMLILISCDIAIQEPRLGSLVVSADETLTRTITPDLQSLHISAYKVIGTGPDSERFEKQAETLPIHIPDLKEGSWSITVEGYNNNNQKIAEKTRTVSIVAGETASETFLLAWISGFGTFQIQISWPRSITDVASIRATISQNDVVIEQTLLDKTMANEVGDRLVIAHSLDVLPTGSYDYALTFLDDSDRILGLQYMEQVNIHDGLVSIGECMIPDGFLPVGNPYTNPLPGEIPYGNSLSLFSSTENAIIHYTLDGSEPTLESELYKGPFVLNRNTTVKAVAVDANGFSSDTVSFAFSLKLQNPSFSPEQGVFMTPQTLHIIHPVAGAKLYYAFNGGDPYHGGTEYTEPILISEPSDITAVAMLDGVDSSELIHGQYQFHTQEPKALPDSSGPHPSPLKVQLSSGTEGATILYTLDGSDPYPNGTVYSESGITLTETATIRAIAVKDDFLPSIGNAWEFVVLQVSEKPVSTHETAVYSEPQLVELSGTNVRFTRNGSDPSMFGEAYMEPVMVSENTRIRVVSIKEECLPSAELDITIKIQAAVPTASPQPGTHTGNQTVVLQSATPEARIRYTTDGTTPTPTSMVFNPAEPIILRQDAVIKAFTEKENMEPSAVVSMDYTILGGTAGVDVIPPTAIHIDFLPSPELSKSSITAFSEGMILAMSPNLSPDATFRWYFDGVAARGNDGNLVGERQVLMFGDSVEAITLHPGSHTIVAKVDKDGMTYSRQLIINVSSTMRQYTVNFDPVEGSLNPAEIFRKVVTTKVYGTLPVPTLPNHEFLGWHTEPDGLGTLITEDTMVDISSNVTLYAYYEPVTVRVLFDAQEGTLLQESHKDLEYGMLYGNLPAVERTGYSFGGWYTEPEGKGQRIDAASPLVSLDEHTLYAKWIAPVTVTFVVADGGTLSFTQKSVLVGQNYGELPEGTKEGHALSGWWLSSNHQGTQISSNSLVETANNHTLYAKWSPFFYAVKFNPDGGSVSTTSTTVTYGTKYGNLPVPTRDGHTFDGWWTTSSSGGTRITSDTIFLTAGMQELYARWTPQQYKITFEAGDYDTLSENNRYITYGNTYGTLPTATRAGYLFQGWYSDEALTRQVNASDHLVVNDEHELYAKWMSLGRQRWLSYENTPYMTARNIYTDEIVVQNQNGSSVDPNSEALPALMRAKEILDDARHSPQYSDSTFGGNPEADILWLKNRIDTFIYWDSFAYSVNIVVPFIARNAHYIAKGDPLVLINGMEHFVNTWLENYTNPEIFLNSWAGDLLQQAMTSCDEFVTISQEIRSIWNQSSNPIASEDVLQGYWDYVFIKSVTLPLMEFMLTMRTEYFSEQLGIITTGTTLFASKFESIREFIVRSIELWETYGRIEEAITYITQGFNRTYGLYYSQISAFRICIDEINRNRVFYEPYVEDWLPIDKHAMFTVQLDLGYGDDPIKQSIAVSEGEEYGAILRVPPDPRPGYSFEGWFTMPDGGGDQVHADDVLSIMMDHTLYAYWVSNAVDVSFDIGFGDKPQIDLITVTRGNPYGSLPKIYASDRPGYEFKGWYTGPDGSGDLVMSDTIVTIAENHTLYAGWDVAYYIGPSGGYVFYDKGLYSDGWRYLEAAPGDWSTEAFRFGYYRAGNNESNKVVGTESGIGKGEDNTKALVETMGSTAYIFPESNGTTARYAAKFCADLVITMDGVLYDDWFLPSKDELDLMYRKLFYQGFEGIIRGPLWSSTEYDNEKAWVQFFLDDTEQNGDDRVIGFKVWPVRAF